MPEKEVVMKKEEGGRGGPKAYFGSVLSTRPLLIGVANNQPHLVEGLSMFLVSFTNLFVCSVCFECLFVCLFAAQLLTIFGCVMCCRLPVQVGRWWNVRAWGCS
jgi:hypothetical protein